MAAARYWTTAPVAGRLSDWCLPRHRPPRTKRRPPLPERGSAKSMAHDILIVDDEADIRLLIAGILRDEGYHTREAANSDGTLEAMRARRPTLVILDIWLQGSTLDGLETLEVIKREHPGLPVIMISGHGNIETAVQSIKLGAYDFIEKPFKADRLLLIIERAMEAARLRRENEELRSRAGPEYDLLGDSSSIGHVRQQIERVLQEQTFERVGGAIRVEVDVRVIASTNRDLAAEMQAGRFRQDLFYRLNVVPIRLPSLRERREDIPLLLDYFMGHSAEVAGLPARKIAADALAWLQAYDWPGNIRQLRNVVDWLLIMAPGDPEEAIRADMLPPDIGSIAPSPLRSGEGLEMMSLPLREAREVFERRYLDAQVSRFGGNISKTAAFIGMERSALHRKLRALGITSGDRVDKGEI